MKTKLILLIVFAFIGLSNLNAQVGIGTTDPKTTLDVVGNPTDGTKVDGFTAPRLTGDQLAAKDALYLADQTGTMVYVTAATTTPAGKTVNVSAPGYYYFDGSVWQKVTDTKSNLWSTDGTDVWRPTGDVGIGTANPTSQLTVIGVGGQTTANLDNTGSTQGILTLRSGGSPGSGGAVTFGGNFATSTLGFAAIKGLAANGTSNTIGDLAFSTRGTTAEVAMTERMRITNLGRVGIGTATPQGILDVNGLGGVVYTGANLGDLATATTFFQPLSGSDKLMVGWNRHSGNRDISFFNAANSISLGGTFGQAGFTFGNIEPTTTGAEAQGTPYTLFRIAHEGVGVGDILAPTAKLDVDGDARVRGLSGTGTRLVTASSTGVLSDFASGTTTGQVIKWNGTAWAPGTDENTDLWSTSGGNIYRNSFVGIGLTDPQARLDILGDNNSTISSLSLRNGNIFNGSSTSGQIRFGYDGTTNYAHFIQTRHNIFELGNSIDFYVSDGSTENNNVLSGSKHVMSLNSGRVGIGIRDPHTSAALDVSSTTKGFLPPRMSTADRGGIANPAAGLTIFNTDNNCLEYYNGTTWISLCSSTP
jgi:hypothetical protein